MSCCSGEGNCKCKKGSIKAQDKAVRSQADATQFSADTERMGLLFSILIQEENNSRTDGFVYKTAKAELEKIIS
jgi:hypothetical protein